MPDMDFLSYQEQDAIEELKIRMKNTLTSSVLSEDIYVFYRFLKARDFDIDKAEQMLRKCLVCRKVFQADKILEEFKPKEVYTKYIDPRLVGFTNDGNLIFYVNWGKINTEELFKCVKRNDYWKHWAWSGEKTASLMKQQAKKTGKMISMILIFDIDGLEFSNATSKITANTLLTLLRLFQDNYPEFLKSAYVINAPSYYVFLYNIIKTVMSNAMIRKFNIFGYSGWKDKFLEVIDADVLPAFLGGKRTDPDGDPYCRSIINLPEKISQKYYLSEEERYFEDPLEVSTEVIRPSEKKDIFVDVKVPGSSIHLKFVVRNKTIKFGLFFQESENAIKEIIPMYEYDTSDGTEENFYKCSAKGKYIVTFDNSGSLFSTKIVEYTISVEKPKI